MSDQLIVQQLALDPKFQLFQLDMEGRGPITILRIGGTDYWLPQSSMTIMRDTLNKMLGLVP